MWLGHTSKALISSDLPTDVGRPREPRVRSSDAEQRCAQHIGPYFRRLLPREPAEPGVLGRIHKVSGGDIEEVTPDPISNSEVKLLGADGTARET